MTTKSLKPQRTCVGCRQRRDQDQLLAITRHKDGTVTVNEPYRQIGRSAYICRKAECLKKARGNKKKSAVQYWLKVKVPDEIWAELEKKVGKLNATVQE